MKIEICSRPMLKQIVSSDIIFPDEALIEIVSYELIDDPVFNHFSACLKLVFSDIEMPNHPDAMSELQAKQIVDFVHSLDSNIENLIVSCEAGMSRSPAVAAAILYALGEDDMRIWNNSAYSPNTYVYRKVLKAFGLDAS